MYLFLACSQAVERVKDQLTSTFPNAPLSAQAVFERAVRRELALLFRYWTTRQIWDRLEANEADAKSLNLVLLRLFTEDFRLPRDGSGVRYAELSTPAEEARELSRRLIHVLGFEHQPLLNELYGAIAPWRDAVNQYTVEALELPLAQLTAQVKAWASRPTRS